MKNLKIVKQNGKILQYLQAFNFLIIYLALISQSITIFEVEPEI